MTLRNMMTLERTHSLKQFFFNTVGFVNVGVLRENGLRGTKSHSALVSL